MLPQPMGFYYFSCLLLFLFVFIHNVGIHAKCNFPLVDQRLKPLSFCLYKGQVVIYSVPGKQGFQELHLVCPALIDRANIVYFREETKLPSTQQGLAFNRAACLLQ